MDDIRIRYSSIPMTGQGNPLRHDDDGGQKSFLETLKESIDKVNELQKAADVAVKDLAIGKAGDIHKTMIAMEKADISFQLMMQVRNKLISAYEEIMRMQV